MSFCSKRIDPLQHNEIAVVEFLSYLYHNGASYSAVNSARCALSTLLVNNAGINVGNSALVKRVLKGIFELKPPSPRYEFIWDVNIVLYFLKNLNDEAMSLEILTHKLVMLLALATNKRAQTLHVICVDVLIFDSYVIIPIRTLLKKSRSGNYKLSLNLQKYHEPSLCVVRVLICICNARV